MFIAAIALIVLAGLVALTNLAGIGQAVRDQRRGSTRGYSCVPLLSLPLAIAGWLLGRPSLGLWPLLPAALDPGTWTAPVAIFLLVSVRVWRRP